MRKDTYIFDLDGTLLDTLDDLTDAVNAALAAYACPKRSREEVRTFVGNGIRKLMERAVPEGDKNSGFPEIFAYFRRFYARHCCDKTKPYPGIIETLTKLRTDGAKIAIVSNKADFAVKRLAERYFPGLVAAAMGENEEAGIRRKPAPDSVLAVMALLKSAPEETLYIGDSEVDVETAENAGLSCVSVTWGFKNRAFLIENGASILIDRPEELLEIEQRFL